MSFPHKIIYSSLMVIFLSACGGGGGGGGEDSAPPDAEQPPDNQQQEDIFELRNFSVISLVDSNPDDTVFEINTGLGEGTGPAGADLIFSFDWEVEALETSGITLYNMNLYLSEDDQISNEEDVIVSRSLCNTDPPGTLGPACGSIGEFVCIWNGNIICGTEENGEFDLRQAEPSIDFFNVIPKEFFLLFEFCNRVSDECVVSKQPATFF